MSYQLVIAEKPSVARSIAGVIGADKKQDGYMVGNGYLVSWCIGHLVSLADAGTYDERFKKWRYDDLPILPQEWQYIIPDDKKKQFDTLRSLMERPDVTGLVCATDAGREGELIFRFVYQMAGCKKPFQRLWISSMEDAAIKESFAHLKPGTDYDNLYQIFSVFSANGQTFEPQEMNCGPVAGAIQENFPKEVEAATSYCVWMSAPLYYGSVRFEANKVTADSLFFQTMGIDVLSGVPEKELMQKDVVFLSDRLARKMFDQENPIGKVISYNKEIELTVKGTYADIPENATVRPDAVISLPTVWSRGWGNYSWRGGDSWIAFIRFRPGADKSVVNARLNDLIKKYRPAEDQKVVGYTAFVKPIRDVYREEPDVKRMRNIMYILGIIILFIATLNYVLISISSLSYRAKAIGVHKCSGAGSGKILGMFLLETAIIILFALLLMGLILLNFRDFIEDTTAVELGALFSLDRLWVPLLTVAILFLIGGALPGRIFARIPVSQVFRRNTEGKKGWKCPLLFVQFAGVAFICGLMYVVMLQYYYVLNKDLGYNPKRVVVANTGFGNKENQDYALTFFRGLPYVESVSSADSHPVYSYSGTMIQDESGQSLFSSRFCEMMEDYPKMMGMVMKEGRMPRNENEVAINETYGEWMHWGTELLNRTVYNSGYVCKVVGVIKDFRIGNFTKHPSS